MTLDEIKDRVQEIRACAGDPERAHRLEDDLHKDVLYAISLGAISKDESQAFANAALKTIKLDFPRWYA